MRWCSRGNCEGGSERDPLNVVANHYVLTYLLTYHSLVSVGRLSETWSLKRENDALYIIITCLSSCQHVGVADTSQAQQVRKVQHPKRVLIFAVNLYINCTWQTNHV